MDKIVEDLVGVADFLDDSGLHKEADNLDKIALKWKNAGDRAPEGLGRDVNWQQAFDVLLRRIMDYGKEDNLDYSTLKWVYSKINEVKGELAAAPQKTSVQEEREAAKSLYYVRPNVVTLAEAITTLAQDIEKGIAEYNQNTNLSDEEREQLKRDIIADRGLLKENYMTLNRFATPEELKKCSDYINSILTGNKGQVVLAPERRSPIMDRRDPMQDQQDKRISYV